MWTPVHIYCTNLVYVIFTPALDYIYHVPNSCIVCDTNAPPFIMRIRVCENIMGHPIYVKHIKHYINRTPKVFI